MDLKLHNTLTQKKEIFRPLKPHSVGIYSCGPTVYWNQHIGHMYAYVHWDSLVRTLNYLGYQTKWVMNITDVGHLTGDNEGDADLGEDKMEKGAQREGLSVWQIADKYIAQFKKSLTALNINEPDVLCRATLHIKEQIKLIEKIQKNGFAYKTQTGLVFDTTKFPDYDKFANLRLADQKAGSRVAVDEEKKKPWDFLLWIVNQPDHIMRWPSPWGVGFPGWHIECTAMSTKYLGETFDIHTGGKEHIAIHHTNEIAQGFGAFGHQTANYWLHNEWLSFNGQKLSKSLGNSILVSDLVAKGFDPLSLRYLILTAHYKTGLNFTWESLQGAETAYFKLKELVQRFKAESGLQKYLKLFIGRSALAQKYEEEFKESLADDLNFAKAIGVVWKIVKETGLPPVQKLWLILDFDKVLGLMLDKPNNQSKLASQDLEIPAEILILKKERDLAREAKDWPKSDTLREKIEQMGYILEDKDDESIVKKVRLH